MAHTDTVLVVLTSHDRLGDTGRPTGFYLPEAAHPWEALRAAGYQVDLASPQGGQPPIDGRDETDPAQQAFLEDPEMRAKLADTLRPDQVDPAHYDAILYAGGHGTMWDFPGNETLADLGRDVYESGGVVAAVCHGPAGLVDITLSDGRPLVEGHEVAAFTNEEEAAVGLTEVVPFLLQDALEARGAHHTAAPKFRPHVVIDGRLVTGQNPASARGVGEAVVKVLDSLV